ncbi:MAG: DUF4358 domain-containing protein [Oscillospiraceae bacterium]|jgi:hypothetical protein|nr:DUF4358 domain-containing protein [Oscillospiraceae bacterium]
MKKAEHYGIPAAMAVCVAVLLVFLFAIQRSGKVSGAAVKTVSAAVTAVTDQSQMKQGNNSMVKRLYGLDPNEYEGVSLYYPSSAAAANEVLVVKLKDVKQQEGVKAAVEARRDSQTKNFNGYGVGQYEMLKASVLDVSGNYVLYVVSKNPKEADAAFQKAL